MAKAKPSGGKKVKPTGAIKVHLHITLHADGAVSSETKHVVGSGIQVKVDHVEETPEGLDEHIDGDDGNQSFL